MWWIEDIITPQENISAWNGVEIHCVRKLSGRAESGALGELLGRLVGVAVSSTEWAEFSAEYIMDEILNNIENNTKIKICGLTRPEEAYFLNEYKVDFSGFVFYEKSKRNVSIDRAKEIMNALDTDIKKVAVTVSPDAALVSSIEEAGFDILQIHGDFDMEVLKMIKIPVNIGVGVKGLEYQ